MKKTVLIVEDEIKIRKVAANYFMASDYTVLEAGDGQTAIDIFQDNIVDLIILDVMLPILDGWTVLRKIRKTADVLIIMLTALGDEEDKLFGFEIGADEYVTKPFSAKVLVARANALLNRSNKVKLKNLESNEKIKIDRQNRIVYIEEKKIDLTPKEYLIIETLYDNKNNCLTRQQILSSVWGYDFFGDGRIVDNHIKNLRSKLKDYGKIIKTVTGLGYTLEIK